MEVGRGKFSSKSFQFPLYFFHSPLHLIYNLLYGSWQDPETSSGRRSNVIASIFIYSTCKAVHFKAKASNHLKAEALILSGFYFRPDLKDGAI